MFIYKIMKVLVLHTKLFPNPLKVFQVKGIEFYYQTWITPNFKSCIEILYWITMDVLKKKE